MKQLAIGGAVLGLAVVLGSRLPQMGEAVGVVASTSDGSPSATSRRECESDACRFSASPEL